MNQEELDELFEGITCDGQWHTYDTGDGGMAIYLCRCIKGSRAGTL